MEGFKKASFLKKILPDTCYRMGDIIAKTEVIVKIYGWRFFSKPAGLELAFLNTRNLPLLSFIYFFIFLFNREVSIEEKSKNGLEIDICSSERVLNFKAEKIAASNQFKTLFLCFKILYSFLPFDFWGCLKAIVNCECSIANYYCTENGKHLQKTMH